MDGYAIYDTADTTRPALETFSTLQEAMDWGNELAESGREAEAEFSDEKEQNVVTKQTEDELDSIDTVSYTHLTLPTNNAQCRSRWSPYH